MSQPHPLDNLLEEMLPTAAAVTVAVRDRDPAAVAEALHPILQPVDLDRLKALIIDLAVMVPDDVRFNDLLAWTHGPHVTTEQYAELVEGNFRPDTKPCTGCGVPKTLDEFYVDRSKPDKLTKRCKECILAPSRQVSEEAA